MGQSSQAELCRKHNLSADQLSKWKHQLVDNAATLFESTDKHANDHSERLLNWNTGWTLDDSVRYPKKSSTWLN